MAFKDEVRSRWIAVFATSILLCLGLVTAPAIFLRTSAELLDTSAMLGAQDPISTTTFFRTYRRPGDEFNVWMRTTADGGLVFAGHTGPAGAEDLWVLKVDSSGNVQWSRSYGGPGSDVGGLIEPTPDGGYILAGITFSYGAGLGDIWLLKLDGFGNVQWAKTVGGGNLDSLSAFALAPNGYIFAGNNRNFQFRSWIVKTDATGNVEWQGSYGYAGVAGGQDFPNAIIQAAGGGFAYVSQNHDLRRIQVVKLDPNGGIVWQRDVSDPLAEAIEVRGLEPTHDGGFLVAGWVIRSGDDDPYLVKLDANGSVQWQQRLVAPGLQRLVHLARSTEGGYVGVGHTAGDALIIKVDDFGNLEWTKTYGGVPGGASQVGVLGTGLAVGGTTHPSGNSGVDAFLLRLNPNGDLTDSSCVTAGQGDLIASVAGFTITPGTAPVLPTSLVPVASPGPSGTPVVDSTLQCATLNRPPDCTEALLGPSYLWPPNHRLVPLSVTNVSDPDGDTVTITVTNIDQDEPIDGLGDGDTSPDATLQPLQVRSERSGTGNGRVYHVTFAADDGHGNSCTATLPICVPHSRGQQCVDEGSLFFSTTP